MGVNDREAAFQRERFWPSLDGLRAISIVAVVWHHAAGHRAGLAGQGWRGVDLFFAISGFLITTLLLRERARTGTVDLTGFYIRRSLRIFPLYYTVLALYLLLVHGLERGSLPGSEFLSNLKYFATYTSNWFVDLEGDRVIFFFAWSLASEEQFYAVWPWVMRFARDRHGPLICMASMVVAWVATQAGVAFGYLDPERLPVVMMLGVQPAICLGSIGAILVHRPEGFRPAHLLLGRRWSVPVLVLAILATTAISDGANLLVAALMACLVIACCIEPDHMLRGVLQNRLVRYIGTVSYGMYLIHMLAINTVRRAIHVEHGWAVFVSGLLLAIAGASLSYRYFERPFLALKEKLAGRTSEVSSVETGVSGPTPEVAPQ